MSSLPNLPVLTPQEYLAEERKNEFRSEYVDGQMLAMSGASLSHNRIVVNVASRLQRQFSDGPCEAFTSDMRVRTRIGGAYFYPDVAVLRGEPSFEDGEFDTLLNPKAIIEVLSRSTENYDRGKKFAEYRNLSSLTEYMLIAQDSYSVEHYVRRPGGHWDFSETTDSAASVSLQTVDAVLRLAEIYHRVKLV